jgi:hypothetical protein
MRSRDCISALESEHLFRTDIHFRPRQVSEALAGLQIMAAQQGITLETNEVEDAFGAQLDHLLDQFR